jgi:hypothetical protein
MKIPVMPAEKMVTRMYRNWQVIPGEAEGVYCSGF